MSTPCAMPACGAGGAKPWGRREAGYLWMRIEMAVCTDVFFPFFFFHPGLPSTTDSKFIKQLREMQESKRIDRIPLIPSTPEEMADMLKLCSYVRFKVPQQVRS